MGTSENFTAVQEMTRNWPSQVIVRKNHLCGNCPLQSYLEPYQCSVVSCMAKCTAKYDVGNYNSRQEESGKRHTNFREFHNVWSG